MADVKISVVVPVYNAYGCLARCVKSILANSFRDYELILVDDGSTDGSSELCDELSEGSLQIKVIHSENKGAAHARNLGVKNAVGEFIAFVDSDDTVSPDYLRALYELTEEEGSDIAVCSYVRLYPGHDLISGSDDEAVRLSFTGPAAMEKLLYQQYFISAPWAMLIRRSVAKAEKFPEGRRAEDVATIYRLFARSKKVSYTGAELYHYYQLPSSTIYTAGDKLNRDYLKNTLEMIEYVKKEQPSYIKAAISRHFSACFQILSETKKTKDNKDLIELVYKNIKRYRGVVLRDIKARRKNRGAALMSYISIPFMHFVLNIHRRSELNRFT